MDILKNVVHKSMFIKKLSIHQDLLGHFNFLLGSWGGGEGLLIYAFSTHCVINLP